MSRLVLPCCRPPARAGVLRRVAAQERPAAAAFRDGAAAQQRGDLERAAEAYRRAIEIEPRFAEAHANLGAVLARLGRGEEAVASLPARAGHQPAARPPRG